jgi:hypothetical protein
MDRTRRRILFGAVASSIGAFAFWPRSLASRLLPESLEYCVPAKNMSERVNAFRKTFIANYLTANKDYPFFEAMSQGKLLPESNEDINRFLRRGVFKVKGITGQPNSRRLTNGGIVFTPSFVAIINDQAVRLKVRIPNPLNIRSDFDSDKLTFQFESKLVIELQEKILSGGVPLPIFEQQVLKSVSLSTAAMVYDFEENFKPENKFSIKLDLTGEVCPSRNVATWFRQLIRTLSVIALLIFTATSCIIENDGGVHGPARCAAPPCVDEQQILEVVRACSAAQEGVLTENGKTYFRVGQDLTNPTQCRFKRADDVRPRCQFRVCHDVKPPSDWWESDAFKDISDDACERDPASSKKNVKWARRCYVISLTPAGPSLPDASMASDYSIALTASDNRPNDCERPTYIFRKTAGNLPNGLVLEEGGTIRGRPTTTGSFTFTVTAIASDTTCTMSNEYTIKVT